ncbi:hypothetical protein JIN85_05490 [Luteolibacter pohnpeiensis]|uniref:Lipoprotein n=1 Tax=Luteolibacter pohnpeiensis TaxID=454153 RepID=A0A934VQ90_9BACT|nr:hypothetical protein [Luteolibacter pohnpeiensis]MBK1881856.1 hypothetical protein [Luteolibacter pohnpeiensis]
MKLIKSTFLILVPTISLGLISCAPPTVGEQLLAQGGTGAHALGEKWNLGEQLVADGKSMRNKGEDMISDGQKLVSKAEARTNEGKKMQKEAETEAIQAGYLKNRGN